MAVDPISPIAPARLRILLLPLGKIKRSRFLDFAKRLQSQNVVRLGDVSPVGSSNRNTFSPLAFPSGFIIYDISISIPPISHIDVFPFELFRESLAVLAITDGEEFSETLVGEAHSDAPAAGATNPQWPCSPELDALLDQIKELKELYPRSLVQRLLIFDHKDIKTLISGPENVTWVPSPAVARSTAIKTLMCDISSLILKELGDFSESVSLWPSIDSPRASSWGPRRNADARPADKLKHRMTMPAQLPSQPNAPSTHHSDTELISHAHESPTTFDEITRSIQLSNRTTAAIKPGSIPASKEHSRERISVQGLASITERSKTRFHARLKVVTGLLYLQGGIWPEALKDLVAGATGARTGSDYIWHAKALEGILICLLLHGWIGMDFQIPQVCFPSTDKVPSKLLPTNGSSESSAKNIESTTSCLKNLASILPDISNYILNLYSRATNITDEPLPQFIYSETTIRLAKLLTAAYVRNGVLDDSSLKHIVFNVSLEPILVFDRPRSQMLLRRTEIASFLFQALPLSFSAEIPITDSVQIYVGMVAVLSQLGLERKRGFILKELLNISIIGLVQARKIGAADIGIHPAAGLTALNNEAFDLNVLDVGSGNTEDSMRDILTLIASIYGATTTTRASKSRSPLDASEGRSRYEGVDTIVERAVNNRALALYGDVALKIDTFRACIDFCEALPDFPGVLRFTVDLLQIIKGSPMLSPTNDNIPPTLAPEEQVRFYNNVKRTVSAANRLGQPDLEAEYWDDFMVRGMEVRGPPSSKQPIQRSRHDFGLSTMSEDRENKGPFIHSAFSKPTTGLSESLVIAGEQNAVAVVLQNPYEFELEIEYLKLDGSGVEFEAEIYGLLLRPFSLEEIVVPFLAKAGGNLKIIGCVVKVKFCRPRRFPIFKKLWRPGFQTKLKRTGLAAKESPLRPLSWSSTQSDTTSLPTTNSPEAEELTINVTKRQPLLEIESSSLAQNALMIMEGQVTTFDVTLRNPATCPVDLIFFTFQDSTTRRLQTALSNKDILPTDVYELEYQLSQMPALRLKSDGNDDGRVSIASGDTAKFTFDVFGKPGLSDAEVQIDYGYTGSPLEVPETFYTRQLNLSIAITVNPSVELVRCNILPLNPDFAWSNHDRAQSADPNGNEEPTGNMSPALGSKIAPFSKMLERIGVQPYGSDYCLLMLDLRNSWSNPLTVSISTTEPHGGQSNPDQPDLSINQFSDILLPGRIARAIVLVPRVFLNNPHQRVPSLGQTNKRQFVVSARKVSYEEELASREAFWYKEELLKAIHCTWKEDAWHREGTVSLRGMRLTAEMIHAFRMDDIEIRFSVQSSGDASKDSIGSLATQTGYSRFRISTNTFMTLCISLFNRSSEPVHPLLRLVPNLRDQPSAIALELSKRLSWTGMLQRPLPAIAPGETIQANLGIIAFCRGEYEIGALVEEVQRLEPKSSAAPFSDSAGNEDRLFENFAPTQNKRRIWCARGPCLLTAQD